MKSRVALAVLLACAAATAAAQSPSSGHPRGSGLQAWQNPGLPAVLAKCKTPPPLNSERLKQVAAANADPANAGAPPEWAPVPASPAIPGVIAAGQNWKVVWSWEGNNTDGPIAGDNGTLLFANNDASNVMKMDPATGLATVLYGNANTAGAVSRSKNGALFVAQRGLGMGIEQLEPQRKMLANSYNGEPLRVRRRRHQRPHGRRSRRCLHLRSGRRRVLRQPAGRRLAVWRRRPWQRHHPEPG